MADRIPSDHDSITTIRATLARSGGLDRPKIAIPAAGDSVPAEELVRVVAGGTDYRARVETPLAGEGREIRGLYETPRLARNPEEGTNHLEEWVAAAGVEFGRSVLVDVVDPGFKYGLREPGERTVYEATGSPDEGLADIADRLGE